MTFPVTHNVVILGQGPVRKSGKLMPGGRSPRKDPDFMQNTSPKGTGIRDMFAAIAPRYDLLNRLLSFGIDKSWRRAAVAKLACPKGGVILDAASGTGDMTLAAARADKDTRIVGVDFCGEMLKIAETKTGASEYRDRIMLAVASCEALPFREGVFDAATIAFGIRNVRDRKQGLREMLRVLAPGGILVVLEFSEPASPFFRTLYRFYLKRLLPAVGGLLSDFRAYRYLPESVEAFPDRQAFKALMTEAGFSHARHTDLSFGIVTIYEGRKPFTSP